MSWIVIPCLVRTRQEYSYCYRETFSVNFARYDAVLENQRRVRDQKLTISDLAFGA